MSSLVFQRLFLDFFLHIVLFPVWWYTGGAKKALFGCIGMWQTANMMLAPGLWLKNIFVPMFGQHDWQGRIMSFFIRLMNVIFRGFGLVLWTVIIVVLFIFWILFPIFLTYLLGTCLF